MEPPGAPHRDRRDAGRRLAEVLRALQLERVTVVALPRGGVPVAAEIGARLHAPVDVLVVRKVGAPGNREYGLGAVAEGGVRYIDWDRVRAAGLAPEGLAEEIRSQSEEVTRLARRLREGRPAALLEGRTVVLVDDGMATGGTVRCAVEAVRLARPARVILAIGVSSEEALADLRPRVDTVVCPLVPPRLFAVGEWYHGFGPVSDAEVIAILRGHRNGSPPEVRAA
jgi:putative phosphoribosyl transferase